VSIEPIRAEASEELGILIDPQNLVHNHTLHAQASTGDWVSHFFTALAWDGEPHAAEPDKHDDSGWHHLDDLPDATIPYVRQALHHIAQGNAYSKYGWPD
jgi:8-oxo-dGTP pyrophosphatase MutT (NUDIX family)